MLRILVCFVSLIVVVTTYSQSAYSKQCIRNKFGSGIAVKVYWVHQKDVKFSYTADGKYEIHNKKKPFETNTLTAATSQCVDHDNAYAIIEVSGGKLGKDISEIALGVGIAVGTIACLATNIEDGESVCAALVEPVTAELEAQGITASAATVAEVEGVIAGAGVVFGFTFIGDGDEVFYVGKPSHKHYLDVWGTVFKPQYATSSKKID